LVALLPRLRRFAAALAGNREDGDDLVQEACEKAIRKAESFREGTRLDSWMYRIIQNCHIDRGRERQRRGAHQPVEETPHLTDGSTVAGQDAALDLKRVRAAMDRLPEDQRMVLLLVTVEGLSYQETATTMDVPIGTVMSRLARARKRLVALLEGAG
jgi:RNA polymerase sigma-70 factor (ECF subfamily)